MYVRACSSTFISINKKSEEGSIDYRNVTKKKIKYIQEEKHQNHNCNDLPQQKSINESVDETVFLSFLRCRLIYLMLPGIKT